MKKNVKIEFKPSKYQNAIFDFVRNGQGNAVIDAKAGAGKTVTLVKALEYMPEGSSVLFTAFNKDIVDEISKKTKKVENVAVKVQSIYGIGLNICKANIRNLQLPPDDFKYRSFIYKNISSLSSVNLKGISKGKYLQYCNNVYRLCELGRLNLAQTVKDMIEIVNHHEIDIIFDEPSVALKVMDWGKAHTDTIDYTDMVWLPNVLNLQPYGYKFDWILTDECQDLNKAQRELILKCRKINTRMIFSGDKKQCLYAFASADPESFDILTHLPNTVSLPLSISYRCAENIVKKAQELVPEIEPNDDGRKGEVDYDVPLSDVKDGDMILCRTNAPLLNIYNKFLRMGRHAFIRGKDIGSNLGELVKNTGKRELNVKLKSDGVFARLYADLIETRDKIMENKHIDNKSAINTQLFTSKLDNIKALEILSEGINSTDELLKRIDVAFPKKKKDMKDGIALSTVHKAKGLEANNVYIACPSLMPSKQAKVQWEIDQEKNLIYVAYTRAKDKLGFLQESEDDKEFNFFEKNTAYYIDSIEPIICNIIGKQYIPHKDETSEIISGFTKGLTLKEKKDTILRNANHTVSLKSATSKPKLNSFSSILPKNKIQKIFK